MMKQNYNSGERRYEIQLWLVVLVLCMFLGIILSACHREVDFRTFTAERGVIRFAGFTTASLPFRRELFSLFVPFSFFSDGAALS